MGKTCSVCKQYKEADAYYTRSSTDLRLKGACQECCRARARRYWSEKTTPDAQREANLRKSFGIGIEDYDKLLEEQKGKCKICGSCHSTFKRRLAVDHCHDTGKIRGLLCQFCNTGLGNFKDNIELLERAKQYLENTNGNA